MSGPNRYGSNKIKAQVVMPVDAAGNPVSSTYPVPTTSVPPTPSTSTKATFVRGLLAPASIGVPERMAAVGTYVQSVLIVAQRASRVANVGTVYIDSISTNDAQQIALAPGATSSIEAPPGKVLDLGDIYVDSVTVTDGVFFLGVL